VGSYTLYTAAERAPASGGGFFARRYPTSVIEALSPLGRYMANAPAGVELRGIPGDDTVKVALRMPRPAEVDELTGGYTPPGGAPARLVEVYFGDYPAPYAFTPWAVDEKSLSIEIDPSLVDTDRLARFGVAGHLGEAGRFGAAGRFDPNVLRIVLPFDAPTIIESVEGFAREPAVEQLPEKRLLVYGSSISQGGSAVRPSGTYAMQLAERLGYDLVNLGLAGSCRAEFEVGEWIASRDDWQLGLFEIGVNLLDSLEAEELTSRVLDFMRPILRAAAERRAGVVLVDLFPTLIEHDGDTRVDDFRQAVAGAALELSAEASELHARFAYHPGSDISLPPDYLSADGIHPGPRGMTAIAEGIYQVLSSSL
jgi:lysophospholipase L1-like esterase